MRTHEKLKKLHAKYPITFTRPGMAWVGEGWVDICDMIIEASNNSFSGSYSTMEFDGVEGIFPYEPPVIICDQAKEKFAGLRFYYHLEFNDKFKVLAEKYPKTAKEITKRFSNFVDGIIHMGELMAAHTCEDTGKPGILHCSNGGIPGWLRTLNEEHAKTDPELVESKFVPYKSNEN